ncbi:MAG: RNA 2',3'-cyclic phosphodiesterase [Thermoproteota archaeon]|nr:RNA 2',3'-cyclic phosphodiesterase [Thermoproteota archaeon]
MRSFIAVDLDMKTRDEIEKLQNHLIKKYHFNSRFKPIKKDNLHLTIKFLGDVNDLFIKKLIDGLSTIRFSPFKITFNGVGVFPNPLRSRIIWLGLDGQSSKQLNDIYTNVNDVLENIDSKYAGSTGNCERFVPHLTIFRINGHSNLSHISFSTGNFIFEDYICRVSLKKSTLMRDGPIYSDIFYVDAY